MKHRNLSPKKKRGSGQTGKHLSARSHKHGKKAHPSHQSQQASRQQQEVRVRGLAAINRVRRGESKSLSAAARAEGTTVRAIRTLVPAAITQARPGSRIRVTASDRYSAKVQVLANEGALTTMARGSRQRELAGQHRATVRRVLRGLEPKSALERYRGKKVGGHELISDYELLSSFAQAGIVGQLDSLYVSPDTSV